MLSVVCDNATNNDVMVDELAKTIPSFRGERSRTRCFAHIINLVAKALLRQFDLPQKKADDALDEAAEELHRLAADIESEEMVAQADDAEDADDEDGWEDMRQQMSPEEREELQKSVDPLRLVLVKVRQICRLLQSLIT